jgi:hypothetical protein
VAGAKVLDLCALGDRHVIEASQAVFRKGKDGAKLERGVCALCSPCAWPRLAHRRPCASCTQPRAGLPDVCVYQRLCVPPIPARQRQGDCAARGRPRQSVCQRTQGPVTESVLVCVIHIGGMGLCVTGRAAVGHRELGAHIDGLPTMVATSFVVGATKAPRQSVPALVLVSH